MSGQDAQSYAAEAAKRSDANRGKTPVYTRVKGVQDPSTYTAAADAAKKSDEDGKKTVKYAIVPSQQ